MSANPAQRFFRVTLMRSAIGLPAKVAGILESMGLNRRLKTVYHPVSPVVAGKIFSVKELIDVEEVDRALSKQELKELRKPDTGFYVESRAQTAASVSWTRYPNPEQRRALRADRRAIEAGTLL